MAKLLYLTADAIGIQTGGGSVTYHELKAFQTLGVCTAVLSREQLAPLLQNDSVWAWDEAACKIAEKENFDLAHCYSSTFTHTIELLKRRGCKVSYTAAAHDIELSRREHEKLSIPFHYEHLTDPQQWSRYVGGYLESDLLIVPSTHSADVMRRYGWSGPIQRIPHGVDLPSEPIAPLPKQFIVGYLGAYGPDKGVRYLLEAWKKLNYSDAVLILAGHDSTSPFVTQLIKHFGGGSIVQLGWVENVSSFYNSISLYVQPSVTEGFGIEVLEAMSYGRPVLCSKGAGAVDVLTDICDICGNLGEFAGQVYAPLNVDMLAESINWTKTCCDLDKAGAMARNRAENFTWDKIEQQYIDAWKGLLA
jgi:glycosyltransferase involved in cell wall biosynthesis